MSITQVTHVELLVEDLEPAVEFHRDVLGMAELGREDGAVSLGCGRDGRCDLVLRGGGTGLAEIGLELDSEQELTRFEQRLGSAGVEFERRTDPRPGVARTVRFTPPMGAPPIELVLGAAAARVAYVHPAEGSGGSGVGPVDFDHVTLKVPDPVATRGFFTEQLEFAVSDEMRPEPETLVAAWMRAGSLHHDVAMFKGPGSQTLHHYALRVGSFDDLKVAADRLAGAGIAVEAGPGRHAVGGNAYLFFWAPGGNRCELSAEMPRVGAGPARVWTDLPTAFSSWGAVPPATFADGS